MIIKVVIPWGVPSKKNSYEIRFHPTFWQQVAHIANRLKGHVKRIYWIGPSKEVVKFEKNASWCFKDYSCRPLADPEKRWEVRANIFLTNDGKDTDNCLGCIGDAMQQGIHGFNDRRIKRWIVEKFVDGRERVELEIREID